MKLTSPTIVIIDDNLVICNALKSIFESVHFKVETYNSALMFLENENENENNNKPSCLIVDVRLPGMSGLELLEQLHKQNRMLPIIVITGYGDILMAVRAMKAGAIDFLLKPFNDQDLLEIVQNCINRYASFALNATINKRIKSLTHREHEIIKLIMEGKRNKEIAFDLSISMSTVEVHRANAMQKLEAKTIAHLIKTYLQAQHIDYA